MQTQIITAAATAPEVGEKEDMQMTDIEVVDAYFKAFQSGQYDKLHPFFHPTFTFTDPSFPSPTPSRSRAIFALFCATMAKQELSLRSTPAVPAAGDTFKVQYTCTYIFGTTKTPVRNEITATVTVVDGLIARHEDVFDVGVWGRQALGWWGVGLGAVGMLEGCVRWWAGEWLERWCGEVGFDEKEGLGEKELVVEKGWVVVKQVEAT